VHRRLHPLTRTGPFADSVRFGRRAIVIEGRLLGVNPYGHAGLEAYKHNRRAILKAQPNPT
jgi:glucose-6-phosphate isomerase